MGIFDWFGNWAKGRQLRKETKIISQLISLLEGEAQEIVRLKSMLIQLNAASDPQQRLNIYVRFERELKQFEQYESIIESLDKKSLRKTIFSNLPNK